MTDDAALVRRIIDRLLDGATHLEVAEDLGLSRHTVDRVARHHGLSRRRAVLPAYLHVLRRRRADLEWMDDAVCGGWPNFTEMTVREQQRACRRCDVRLQCLLYGLEMPVPTEKRHSDGTVYGGYGPHELSDLQKAQRLAAVQSMTKYPDHPHSDPGDGRTECETCGKWVWLVTHSCKGLPVTQAAVDRWNAKHPDLPIARPL